MEPLMKARTFSTVARCELRGLSHSFDFQQQGWFWFAVGLLRAGGFRAVNSKPGVLRWVGRILRVSNNTFFKAKELQLTYH